MSRKIKLPVGGPDKNEDHWIELEPKQILCNDVRLPGESGARDTRLWILESTLGNFPIFLGAVWADCEQDALDTLINEGLGDFLIVDEEDLKEMDEDEKEELVGLGNASELCDLSNSGLLPVTFVPARDWKLLCMFAEARGAGHSTLDDL